MTKGSNAPRSPSGGRRITARAGFGVSWTPPNKRMHATADTTALIFGQLVGRRVMRGVRRALLNGGMKTELL